MGFKLFWTLKFWDAQKMVDGDHGLVREHGYIISRLKGLESWIGQGALHHEY